MNNLYEDLAHVYEAMYATFIDYVSEYSLYEGMLRKHGKNNLLEIGCGTGKLSEYFVKDSYIYQGLDLSDEMLQIARERNPNTVFHQGDMRTFRLEKPVGSIVMAGRTISYLVQNDDVNSMLRSAYENLDSDGLICFDFINANEFIPKISDGLVITHKAQYHGETYLRESRWKMNLKNNLSFDWTSSFYKKEENELVKIGMDSSTIRTFTKDEILLFLTLSKFEVKEIFKKESYAFPTYIVLAEKSPN